MATSNMKLIGAFFIKLWGAQGFFHSRSSMAVSNMNLIRALVSQLRETQALACSGGGEQNEVGFKQAPNPPF